MPRRQAYLNVHLVVVQVVCRSLCIGLTKYSSTGTGSSSHQLEPQDAQMPRRQAYLNVHVVVVQVVCV
jgi:hypothetical protein